METQNTALLGKLCCKSCIGTSPSGSRKCHFHFSLFFSFSLAKMYACICYTLFEKVKKHCFEFLFLVQKTEELKHISIFPAVFKYFSSSDHRLQKYVWNTEGVSWATQSSGGSAARSPSCTWIQPQDISTGRSHMAVSVFARNNPKVRNRIRSVFSAESRGAGEQLWDKWEPWKGIKT